MMRIELNDVPYFYVRNIQGDVVAILDEHGTIVAEYQFDAWGNLLNDVPEGIGRINPITYRGYYWDWELDLFYLQSRYYCPQLRRFISADALLDTGVGILGTNMYIYCNNDPINFWDPTGFSPIATNSGALFGRMLRRLWDNRNEIGEALNDAWDDAWENNPYLQTVVIYGQGPEFARGWHQGIQNNINPNHMMYSREYTAEETEELLVFLTWTQRGASAVSLFTDVPPGLSTLVDNSPGAVGPGGIRRLQDNILRQQGPHTPESPGNGVRITTNAATGRVTVGPRRPPKPSIPNK